MAAKTSLTPENAPAKPEDRARLIKETIDQVAKLEADIKTIRARIGKVKQQNIKGALGMKIADFNACERLYHLEDDAREQYLQTLGETFAALGIGAQLTLFDKDVTADKAA